MINGIVSLWNWVTEGSVKVSDVYIEYFFYGIDDDRDGKISRKE